MRGCFYWLAARALLYPPSYRQDSTCHGLKLYQLWKTGWIEKYLNVLVHHGESIKWSITQCADDLPLSYMHFKISLNVFIIFPDPDPVYIPPEYEDSCISVKVVILVITCNIHLYGIYSMCCYSYCFWSLLKMICKYGMLIASFVMFNCLD